ncbi:hypothetical protein BDZ85DRAFT_279611 [Elsinoe ampelina]|uniref:Zn(2)-C6 fungal-type domain-containing protein n=1 Tax=Elsinoe ampelina TaxID=302913 RepID=A0A6A6GKC3_9PEZI|nr:hypothetical protein BDZ85DRAFT_279611 [Elsinoe ampelina]
MSISPTKGHWGDSVRPSPRARDQKQVTFELLLPVTQSRARLPMRVMISKHDTTDSIITTVKNFYGLYDGPGVSFQDRDGNILIAAYENFDDGMIVFVKVSEDVPLITDPPVQASPKRPKLGPPFEMRPPTQSANRTRSPSPVSINASTKGRARSHKSQDVDGLDMFSDSDGGNGSVSSSRRSRAEAHASAEISVDNILEGGRRKRAKFESSELPLFVPPQVPVTNSVSSVSPQRRANGEAASPLPFSNQRTFMYNQPLPSPQSYGRSDYINQGVYGQTLPYNGHQLRGRPAMTYQPRRSIGGILPTPEPTVGSVISDEDVALQLMRLGDASNLSHGRTSTSTVDDALSGKAEAASSDEEETDDEDIELPAPRYPIKQEGPQRKKPRLDHIHSDTVDSSGDEYNDTSFKGDSDEIIPGNDSDASRRRGSKTFLPPKPRGSMSSMNGKEKKLKKNKAALPSPASGAPSRKTSLGSTQLGPDEEDLSSKPRCQRCRKSKKGCDRQRPCGRCKDAGIGIDGCVSEDEGNGRRGRYGRHMGVAIKKDGTEGEGSMPSPHATPGGTFLTPALPIDKMKSKKRKLPPV